MRITNSMITLHNQRNINTTKELTDKYNEQMTTQKKISKPSDDPVIAIRSLRLRDSLNEVTQYVDKNIPDASSWLENTETALKNMESNLRDAYNACVSASNGGPLTTEDRNALMQNLKAISDHVYMLGNADYAGRTVFTGYKTNKTLTFQEDTTNLKYDISENFDIKNIAQKKEYTNVMTVPTNWEDGTNGLNQGYPLEKEMGEYTVDRIRLAYAEVGDVEPVIQFTDKETGELKNITDYEYTASAEATVKSAQEAATADGKTIEPNDPTANPKVYEYTDANGTTYKTEVTEDTSTTPSTFTSVDTMTKGSTTVTRTTNPDGTKTYSGSIELDGTTMTVNADGTYGPVKPVIEKISLQDWDAKKFKGDIPNPDKIYYIPDSGEIILGENVSKAFKQDALNRENEQKEAFSLKITYEKNIFKKGEVRPEMYFDCVDKTNPEDKIEYTREQQDISYTIAMEQELKVNTQAGQDGILSTDIGRDIEELINAIRAAQSANDKVDKIKALKENPLYASEDKQAKLNEWMEAANREKTYLESNLQNLFSNGITRFQNYERIVNLAKTDVGSRVSRLELTKTRMTTSKQTLNTLIKDNEDRELSDILIDYKAAYNSYESSLKAASKINELSLLNYL